MTEIPDLQDQGGLQEFQAHLERRVFVETTVWMVSTDCQENRVNRDQGEFRGKAMMVGKGVVVTLEVTVAVATPERLE